MEDIVLLGFGGHAKSVVDTIEKQGKYRIIGFLDVPENNKVFYRGYTVIGGDQDAASYFQKGVHNAFITVGYLGSSRTRNKLYTMLKEAGFCLPVIQDETAVLSLDCVVEEGTYIGKNVILNANSHIHKMGIINTGAIVEHDCQVGEFSHVAVGAVLCGNVWVGNETLVGANATVIQECKIGNNVIVGAGCTVLQDIEDNQKYYGKK